MPTVLLIVTAAPAEAPVDWTALTLGALAFAAGYAFACWFWPWTSCRRCDGKGKFRSPSGKNWRKCPRCKGSAAKVRLGRRVWDYFMARR